MDLVNARTDISFQRDMHQLRPSTLTEILIIMNLQIALALSKDLPAYPALFGLINIGSTLFL